MQERRNSIVSALELRLSSTNPSRYSHNKEKVLWPSFIMGIPVPGKIIYNVYWIRPPILCFSDSCVKLKYTLICLILKVFKSFSQLCMSMLNVLNMFERPWRARKKNLAGCPSLDLACFSGTLDSVLGYNGKIYFFMVFQVFLLYYTIRHYSLCVCSNFNCFFSYKVFKSKVISGKISFFFLRY